MQNHKNKRFFLTYQPSNCLNFVSHRSDGHFFPEWKQSQISLLWCVNHISPLQTPCLASNRPRWTHAKKRFLLCFKRAVWPEHGEWRWEKVERQKGVTEETGLFRGTGIVNPDGQASVPLSQS